MGGHKMPTTNAQRDAFLALKHNKHKNECWEHFLKHWDGFISVIISRKLFFAASIWEDAKLEAEAKMFRYIERFDESREVSPWLSRVIVSACEDVKKNYGYDMKNEPKKNMGDSLNCESSNYYDDFKNGQNEASDIEYNDEWLSILSSEQEESDAELFEDMWCCVNSALDDINIDMRKKNAFILFYRYDYKLREIAKIFQLEQSTVNNWPGAVLKKIMPQVRREMSKLGYATNSAVASHSSKKRRG
jgi:RNA polymerase sigma factor (sigma-70 family)